MVRIDQQRGSKQASLIASVLIGLLALSQAVMAGPKGGTVSAGNGSISQPNATTTNVLQNTNRMAIDWQSFNLTANETVNFNQPSVSSAVLNRIHDQNPSQIFGAINANGRVFLANPNGIIFGQTATVNVGALIAAGMNISNDDFMAGNYKFTAGENGAGVIVNRGLINAATGGSVGLLGGTVINEGIIVADYGNIELASGNRAVVNFDGDGLLNIQVSEDVINNAVENDAAVSNRGSLLADGGQVVLTAHAASDVFDNAINNEGIIKAARIDNTGGVIRLVGNSGTVLHSGDINAQGEGGTGGTVHVLGDRVGLIDHASIDTSGDTGGGTVLIGGDYQGKGDIQTASRTYVGSNATINADAVETGDGGQVVVWADEITRYYGSISSRGGSRSGNGGDVEVSGKQWLDFHGDVDLTATAGTGGTLLLDPRDIYLASATDCALIPGCASAFDETARTEANINDPPQIIFSFRSGEDISIDITDTIKGASLLHLQAERNIFVESDLLMTRASSGSVFLEANNNINVNAAISASSDGDIKLHAGNSLAINADLTTSGGTIELSGIELSGIEQPVNITQSASSTVAAGTGTILIDANGGTIDLSGSLTTTNDTASAVRLINAGSATLGNISATTGTVVLGETGNILSGAITQNAGTEINAANLTADGGGVVTLANSGNSIDSLGAITGGDAVTVLSDTGLNVNGDVTGNGVGLTGTGITQNATSTVNAGAGLILVDANGGAINMSGALNTTNSTATAVRIIDATSATLGNISATTGTVVLGETGNILSGAITQNAGTEINAANLTADGGGVVTLANSTNTIDNLGAITGGNAVTVLSDTGLNVNGDVTGSGVSLTGTGITQNATSTVNAGAGLILVDANGDAINMSGALNTTNSTATAVRIIDATSATLGNISATTGTVVLGEAGGDNLSGAITQNSGTEINTANLKVNGGDAVTLANSGNSIDSLGEVKGMGAVSLRSDVALAVNGNITGDGVSLFADTMTFTGTIEIGAGSGIVTLSTNALDRGILVGGDGTSGGSLEITDGMLGQITTTDTGGVTIGSAVHTAGISVVGDTTKSFDGSFTLRTQGNAAVNDDITATSNILINAASNIVFDPGVNITATGGDISLFTNGTITGNGALTIDAAEVLSFDQALSTNGNTLLKASQVNITKNINVRAGDLDITGNTSIVANITITSGGVLSINANTTLADANLVLAGTGINLRGTLDVNNGNLTLDAATGILDIDEAVTVTTTTSGDMRIIAKDLTLDGAITSAGTVTVEDNGKGMLLVGSEDNQRLHISRSEYDRISTTRLILSSADLNIQGSFEPRVSAVPLTINAANLTISGTNTQITLLNSLDLADSAVSVGPGLAIDVASRFAMNNQLNATGSVSITAATDIIMGLPSELTTTNGQVNMVTTGGDVLLGLIDVGNANVNITASAGSILNNNGVFEDITQSKTNVRSTNVTLDANQRIGASSTDAITLDIYRDGQITLDFGAPKAFINNLQNTRIVNLGSGDVAIGLIFSAEIIGTGHYVGVNYERDPPASDTSGDKAERAPEMISLVGADYKAIPLDEEEEITSTLSPTVPVLIRTTRGWEFKAPSRNRQPGDAGEQQKPEKKGTRYIDWL